MVVNYVYIIGGISAGIPIAVWIYRKFLNRVARLNLPGPGVSPFLGDVFDFGRHKYQLHLLLDEYFQKYGNLFAFYHQGQPVICVADNAIIHEIMWKEYKNFPNRKFFIDLPSPCSSMVTMVTGEKVKMVRDLVKSLVTVSSIKNMSQRICDAVDTTDKLFKQAAIEGDSIDANSLALGYVMEVLTKIGFSLDAPNQLELNNTLVSLSTAFTRPSDWINLLAAIPLGRHLVKYVPAAYKNQLQPFIEIATKLVNERREESHSTKKDVLTALLAAQEGNKDLLDSDLLAQGIVLLTAVHVATSTTISIASYYIAKHEDVQAKIHEELDQWSSEDDFPTLEHLQRLEYLDNVIKEVLRLYPSGFMLMRECTNATTIVNVHFKKGDTVLIPTYSIHRDGDVFKNPEQFNPDRFNENKPSRSQYHPFGDGMRGCVGKEMAMTEMKLYFAKLLSKYQVKLADRNQALNVRSHLTIQAMMAVEDPVKLQVTTRSKSVASPC